MRYRIKFFVGDRRYEAVSFLEEGECSVSGDEMLRRVSDAIGEEDEQYIAERVAYLPAELRYYWLVTNRRDSAHPRCVMVLSWYETRWYRCYTSLDVEHPEDAWNDRDRVVCRLS